MNPYAATVVQAVEVVCAGAPMTGGPLQSALELQIITAEAAVGERPCEIKFEGEAADLEAVDQALIDHAASLHLTWSERDKTEPLADARWNVQRVRGGGGRPRMAWDYTSPPAGQKSVLSVRWFPGDVQ